MEQIGKLFLDELYVGREFRSSEHALDAEQIKAFGSQFDPQPFHLDEDKANESVFQGLAASGWHTAAVTMKLLVESVPFAHGIIGAGGEIEWPSAARPGDVLHVDSKVLEIKPSRSKPDRGFVVLEGRTVNQTGEVRQIVKARLMAFKK